MGPWLQALVKGACVWKLLTPVLCDLIPSSNPHVRLLRDVFHEPKRNVREGPSTSFVGRVLTSEGSGIDRVCQ